MEDISTASAAPKRDNALLNQSLDDIIKQNRVQRLNGKKNKPVANSKPRPTDSKNQGQNPRNRNNRPDNKNKQDNNNKKMMDTTPVRNGNIQKQRGQQRDNSRTGKLIVRSNSGRPHFDRNDRNKRSSPAASAVASSTPGLRQPWEKLPTAPLPAEPLKISIRNELADRPVRRSDHPVPSSVMMVDTEPISHSHVSSSSSSMYRSTYEPRDALASRDEYRIGNRFATQGMAIDYQLPSGASFDTRPARRY